MALCSNDFLEQFTLDDDAYERHVYSTNAPVSNLQQHLMSKAQSSSDALLNLSEKIYSFAPAGGWLAVYTEDSIQERSCKKQINVFTTINGRHVVQISWNRPDSVICIGWIAHDDTLVALDSGGIYRIYSNIHVGQTDHICEFVQFTINLSPSSFILDAKLEPHHDYLFIRASQGSDQLLFYGIDFRQYKSQCKNPGDTSSIVSFNMSMDTLNASILSNNVSQGSASPSKSDLSMQEIRNVLWTCAPYANADSADTSIRGIICIAHYTSNDPKSNFCIKFAAKV